MFIERRILVFVLLSLSILASTASAAGQSSQSSEKEFWPAFNANIELGSRFRLQGIIEKRDGEEGEFVLWRYGAVFSYQAFRKIKRPNADIEDEDRHYIVLGGGYEFLRTNENGAIGHEHRAIVQFTPKRSVADILLQDRNPIGILLEEWSVQLSLPQ